jgi:hypothetical protein
MGMFDSLYDGDGYDHEWQTKAYYRNLDEYRIGDQMPDCVGGEPAPVDYQVEVLGGPENDHSLATIVGGVLVGIHPARDDRLPLVNYGGHVTGSVGDLLDCNDCGRDVDPNDAAPSCGAHALCTSCWTTGGFRCRECLRVWAEEKVADATDWFATIKAMPPLPSGLAPWSEPEPPEPLDLGDVDVVMSLAMSIHRCSHCDQGIHVGHPQVSYRPLASHHFTLYFHESCVLL